MLPPVNLPTEPSKCLHKPTGQSLDPVPPTETSVFTPPPETSTPKLTTSMQPEGNPYVYTNVSPATPLISPGLSTYVLTATVVLASSSLSVDIAKQVPVLAATRPYTDATPMTHSVAMEPNDNINLHANGSADANQVQSDNFTAGLSGKIVQKCTGPQTTPPANMHSPPCFRIPKPRLRILRCRSPELVQINNPISLSTSNRFCTIDNDSEEAPDASTHHNLDIDPLPSNSCSTNYSNSETPLGTASFSSTINVLDSTVLQPLEHDCNAACGTSSSVQSFNLHEELSADSGLPSHRILWYHPERAWVHEESDMHYSPSCRTFYRHVSDNPEEQRFIFYKPDKNNLVIANRRKFGKHNQMIFNDNDWDRKYLYGERLKGYSDIICKLFRHYQNVQGSPDLDMTPLYCSRSFPGYRFEY